MSPDPRLFLTAALGIPSPTLCCYLSGRAPDAQLPFVQREGAVGVAARRLHEAGRQPRSHRVFFADNTGFASPRSATPRPVPFHPASGPRQHRGHVPGSSRRGGPVAPRPTAGPLPRRGDADGARPRPPPPRAPGAVPRGGPIHRSGHAAWLS